MLVKTYIKRTYICLRLVESFRTFCNAVNRNQKGIKMLMPFQAIEFLLQKMPSRIDEVAEYFR